MKNMWTKSIVLAILICVTSTVAAQKDKIKGNRNVEGLSKSLDPFTSIKVTDGLEVTLIKDAITGYDLEMDDNLFDVISFEVRDSILEVSTLKQIRSSKKLDIIVRFQELKDITVDSKSKVISKSPVGIERLNLTLMSGGFYEGDIKSDKARVTANENSKCKITYLGDDITFMMSDNSFVEVDVNTALFNITADGRSDINLKGNAKEAILNVMGTAELKGRTFDVDQVTVNGRDSGKIIVSVDKDIIINLDNKSELQLYGLPAIVVEQLAGTSRILKKE